MDTDCTLSDILGSLGASAGPISYPVITSAELFSGTFTHDYLIDDILVAGEPVILAGGKKSLKTCTLIDLGISLVSQTPFLGQFKVNRQCRVMLMSGESGQTTLSETAKRIAKSKGVEPDQLEGLVWSERLPQFGDPSHLLAVDRLIKSQRIDVLMIDPAYMAMPSMDAKNLFDVGSRLRGMNNVCSDNGTTLLLCHHTRKNQHNQFDPPQLEEIAFAGFQEWARQWLLLGRQEQYEPGSGRHRLWLSVGGSAGHSGLYGVTIDEGTERPRQWRVEVSSADESRQEIKAERNEAKQSNLEARLLEAINTRSDGATQTTLATVAGASSKRTKEALTRMSATGKVRVGQNGSKTLYFPIGDSE